MDTSHYAYRELGKMYHTDLAIHTYMWLAHLKIIAQMKDQSLASYEQTKFLHHCETTFDCETTFAYFASLRPGTPGIGLSKNGEENNYFLPLI
jgi:hypothetical protein